MFRRGCQFLQELAKGRSALRLAFGMTLALQAPVGKAGSIQTVFVPLSTTYSDGVVSILKQSNNAYDARISSMLDAVYRIKAANPGATIVATINIADVTWDYNNFDLA